jgi:RNA polymerase sigma-70 factor, ECF subfamily
MPGIPELANERELVIEARRDPEAFRQLYRHYFPRVFAYVSYRVGRAQDAEDLTAEAFLKAVEGLSSFRWRGARSFAAWLFRIAHNLVVNFYRDRQSAPEPVPAELLPDLPASDELPADALARKELLAHLRNLIKTLSPRQQEIVTLRFFGGLRNQEIAALLNLDERTVAAHLCRGIRTLQARTEGVVGLDPQASPPDTEVSYA